MKKESNPPPPKLEETMKNNKIKLGDRAKCKLTGFVGIVVVQDTWLNGCVRVGLQSEELKKDDKTIQKIEWLDEDQCELVEAGVHKPSRITVEDPPSRVPGGGPRPDPKAPGSTL